MTETVTQERRNEIADGLESMAETLGLAKGHQAILRNASRALRQSDTRIEGGGAVAWQRRLMNTVDDVGGRKAGEWGPWKECSAEQAEYAMKTGGVEGFSPPLKAEARPVYTTPTPEHVEGDVLSVGEMAALIGRLDVPVTMSQFATKTDLYMEVLQQRKDASKALTSATTRIQRAERERDEAREHIEQLSELLKIIKEHWIDYDHVFSIAVHEADQFLASLGEKQDAE